MIFSAHGGGLNTKAKQKRRFVYDDYGHHPTEIKATLKGRESFSAIKYGAFFNRTFIAGLNCF